VSFAEAATVFADPLAVYLDDGSGMGRMVVIGTSLRERVLYVVHVERGERDRIISARSATAAERAYTKLEVRHDHVGKATSSA
jgi:uncharacterized DUF497 family protein